MKYKNPEPLSGRSPSAITMPTSYIDAQMLYDELSLSIASKNAALEIWLDQTRYRQETAEDQARIRTEFTMLADQYELDLIIEALTVVIQHSAMRDYCLRLPVTPDALQMISTMENSEFETLPFFKSQISEDTYVPSILGFYKLGKIAVMASVGVFSKLSDDSLQTLKRRMMAAALTLPDYFQTDEAPKALDAIHLALIDCEIKISNPEKHIWSLKDIDQLVFVTGAGKAVQILREILQEHVRELLNRAQDKTGIAEKIEPLKKHEQPERRAMVRVVFMEPNPQGFG